MLLFYVPAVLTLFSGKTQGVANDCTYNYAKLVGLHNETQTASRSQTERWKSNPNGHVTAQMKTDWQQLNENLGLQMCMVRKGVDNARPTTQRGIDFQEKMSNWLKNCSDCTRYPCIVKDFVLDGKIYLPYLNHADVLVPYVDLLRRNDEQELTKLFALLPWCLGQSIFMNNCGVHDKTLMIKRVTIMCKNGKDKFPPCKDFQIYN